MTSSIDLAWSRKIAATASASRMSISIARNEPPSSCCSSAVVRAVDASGPKKYARISLSKPTTSKPARAKERTDSEPISPPEPVTIAVGTTVDPSPDPRSHHRRAASLANGTTGGHIHPGSRIAYRVYSATLEYEVEFLSTLGDALQERRQDHGARAVVQLHVGRERASLEPLPLGYACDRASMSHPPLLEGTFCAGTCGVWTRSRWPSSQPSE